MIQPGLRIAPSVVMVQGGSARSNDRSVSCNSTGWSSQYLSIGPSVVMVQGDPARSKDRSVSCNGTGWSNQYIRIGRKRTGHRRSQLDDFITGAPSLPQGKRTRSAVDYTPTLDKKEKKIPAKKRRQSQTSTVHTT